jgi:hypothetical protein
MREVFVDTGTLSAALNRKDHNHRATAGSYMRLRIPCAKAFDRHFRPYG